VLSALACLGTLHGAIIEPFFHRQFKYTASKFIKTASISDLINSYARAFAQSQIEVSPQLGSFLAKAIKLSSRIDMSINSWYQMIPIFDMLKT